MTRPESEGGFWIRRRCPGCGGAGMRERPLDQRLDAVGRPDIPSWECEAALLGEGQLVEPDLEELVPCRTCAGEGTILVQLTPQAYRRWRRRRLLRGILLFLLGLIPLLVLGLAIAANPEMLCGRWWYGLAWLLFVAVAGARI